MNTSHFPDYGAHSGAYAAPLRDAAAACIGVFDSGVGGLSVLRELHRRLPTASLLYVGDVAHAPYGVRPAADVRERCERIVAHLIDEGAGLIVVACNTATVLTIEALRRQWPGLSFVGVEPGVKPAAAASRTKRIAVMATPATVRSARLQQLINLHAAPHVHVHLQACPGLADAIERGALKGQELLDVLVPCCEEIRAAQVDIVVLGCTHYPFIASQIAHLLGPDVALIDTAVAVAERVASVWSGTRAGTPAGAAVPSLRVQSTGNALTMRRMLLECPGFEAVPVESLSL